MKQIGKYTINIRCIFIIIIIIGNSTVAVPIRSTEHSMWKPILKHAGKTDFQSSLYEIRHTVAPDSCK